MLQELKNMEYVASLESSASSMEVVDMNPVGSLAAIEEQTVVEFSCFGTLGTIGTFTGCFGSFGTFGCIG